MILILIIILYSTYKDKTAWIVDQSRTQTQSPMLTELKESFRSIREICQTYRHMLLQTNVTLS